MDRRHRGGLRDRQWLPDTIWINDHPEVPHLPAAAQYRVSVQRW